MTIIEQARAWPLRLVVDHYELHGVEVEKLECGHVINRKQDAFAYTHAVRRRCRHCAAARRALTDDGLPREG